jgi:cell wall-associated NlpC family hydrolase
MAMENFPNKKQPAITIATADLRVLPTRDPSFGDYRQAGEGYPFDYLQAALLPANLPVFILQTTRDGAWSLVVSFFDIGWVESKALAMANPAFMQQWQSGSYVTFLQDASVFDAQNQFRFQARIGSLLPLAERITTPQTRYSVWIAVADSNQQAVLKKTWIEAQIAAPWPLPITAQQIAAVINQLLKTNYGWGEYNGYRDCSATQMNLFAVFGVWLPRTSEDQRLVGQFVDLSHLHAYAKQQKILSEGQPFLTLLHLPGHVVLYIGEKNKRAYVFHNFWGAHTENLLGQKGRSIYGHAAITPVDLGKGYMNIPKPLLNSVQSMTILK